MSTDSTNPNPCSTCPERASAIEETLQRLREVLSALPDDELAGQLARLRGRAQLIDPRDRPAEPASLTRSCPQCSSPSRPHRYAARMWCCTAERCSALWSMQRGQAVIETVL